VVRRPEGTRTPATIGSPVELCSYNAGLGGQTGQTAIRVASDRQADLGEKRPSETADALAPEWTFTGCDPEGPHDG
jgi:hypothetical protein